MTRRSVSVLVLLLASGCASAGTTTAPPLPFPGALPPPVSATAERPPPTLAPLPGLGDAVATTALSYRGVKYVFGGEDPKTGFDCSGFVQYVFAQHAIDVPRTVPDQFRRGLPVQLTDLRGGDLVFFSTTGPGPTHVGIAVSRDEFVHAPSTNGVVRVEAVDNPYWHVRFIGARRLF